MTVERLFVNLVAIPWRIKSFELFLIHEAFDLPAKLTLIWRFFVS